MDEATPSATEIHDEEEVNALKGTRKAVRHRFAQVDEPVAVFLEAAGDQLGRAGSPIERWARLSGFPTALAKFISQESADLADDIEQLVYDDHRQFLSEIKTITGGRN